MARRSTDGWVGALEARATDGCIVCLKPEFRKADGTLEIAHEDDTHPSEVERLTTELAFAQERYERFTSQTTN